jgi:hypothetical protein
VERACGGSSGRHACAIGAHGQTYQRRISHRSLNPAYKHHDAGAGRGGHAACAALAAIITGSDRAIAVTASHSDGSARAGGGQKAARAEISAPGRAGSARARGGSNARGASSRRRE